MKVKLPYEIRRALQFAFAILTGVSTVASLCGYSIKDIDTKVSWWKYTLVLLGVYVILTVIIYFVLNSRKHKPYGTKINGNKVKIFAGDIFSFNGWKLIPFNERFDTLVDDKIIAHNTLHGMMVDNYANLDELDNIIKLAADEPSRLRRDRKNRYPLGRIIVYKDFLLLAFTHFDDQNRAYVGIDEYESILLNMWAEIRRVYAAKPIAIPLLGGGITTINGTRYKDYTELLKCILCTLRRSNFQSVEEISIILTDKVLKEVDMNRIKEVF